MNLLFKSFLLCLSFASFAIQGFSQAKARVEGLKDNQEYMSLMKGLYQLEIEQDSVLSLISEKKKTLSGMDELQVIEATNDILDTEGVLFEIRSKLGNIKNKSSIIEQEYIISSLESGAITSTEDDLLKENNTDTDILKTSRIKNEIPADIYTLILTGDNVKAGIERDFRLLMDKVGVLSELISKYTTVGDKIVGDSLESLFEDVNRNIKILDVNATKNWNRVYETQIDQYNRLLDKFSAPSPVVDRLNEKSRQVRNEEANIDINFMAPSISKYNRQRSLVMQYEKEIADILNLSAASEFLKESINKVDLTYYDVKRVYLPMQDMIEYLPLSRASSKAHSAKNLPTELVIPTRGEMHKVEIGTYTNKLTTVKSHISPAEYLKLDSGKYRYWAGSYKTLEEAQAASKALSKIGVKSKVASWKDGVNSVDSTLNVGKFKIEIPFYTTTIIDIVERVSPGKEINKKENKDGAESYEITLFTTRGEAENLAALIGSEAKIVMVR